MQATAKGRRSPFEFRANIFFSSRNRKYATSSGGERLAGGARAALQTLRS
jgi:hypothetical protein